MISESTTKNRRCRACGQALEADASFCIACGVPTRVEVRRVIGASQAELSTKRRTVTALVVAYAGTLGGVALTQCVARWSNSEALPILLCASLQLAVGLASVTILGKRAFRRSFAFRPNARDLLLGAGGGLVMFAIGWLYVRFLRNFSGSARQVAPLPSLVWLVVGTIVLAPLIEEWLCRGVIWQATTQLAPEATVIVTTALLFALLHGVSWGVFGLPHRFAGGLVLGWVRRRTGSLVPVIVGHFINNSLSLAVP